MGENKKYVELIWYRKYDKINLGKKMPIEKPNLPFQIVETVNKPRVKDGYARPLFPEDEWPENYPKDWKNLLIWGDNKLVMSSLIKQGWAGKINLIYIDPPFFTGADFTVKTKVGNGEIEKAPSIIEERAYRDTWAGGMASYLKYMYERLVLMRELLADNGSIYVHCDDRLGHYLKVIMDEIFGYDNFLNQIIWRYTRRLGAEKKYPSKHDIILFYAKTSNFILNPIYKKFDELNLDEKDKLLRWYNKKDKNGLYETVYWQDREDEYLSFMLKLYQAQPLTGFRYLHGRKGERAVHVGPLNAPVTMEEVEKVVVECRTNNFNKADVLGWEWSYEVNELAKVLAKENGVDLKLVQIPSVNEIKSSLVGFDLQLLKVPDQVVKKELSKYVKFSELAYLEIDTETNGKEVILKITDFQIPPTAELAEIASKVKDSRELIDYWAIDWDYKGDTFHNQWQSFRTKKNLKVDYEAKHRYDDTGEYQIMVKVVDVFGNDTNKVLKVRIG